MRVLSLFDGISCGQVALERAGIPVEVYYASEIDQNAIKVTQKNYPNTQQLGDVTKLTNLPEVDLLMGGSPCQSLSITTSNKRENLNGKSKLFFEYVRILEEVKPKWFLFENVASMNTQSKDVISTHLGAEPLLIDSSSFSAQRRPRLYWTNIPLVRVLNESPLVLKDILEDEVDEKFYYNCGYDFHGLDKPVCATLHINGHDILKRVHSPEHKCHTLTAVCGGNQQKKVYVDGRVRKLTPLEYERLQTLPDNYTSCVSNAARYKAIGNGWTVDVIAHILKNLKEN